MLKSVFLSLLFLGCMACTTTPQPQSETQLEWVLSIFNEKAGQVSKDDIHAHFHPMFLAQVSPDQTVSIFTQLAAQLGKLTVKRSDPPTHPAPGVMTTVTHVAAVPGPFRIVLSIDTGNGLINGLFVQPDPPAAAVQPIPFESAVEQLKAISPNASLMLAEVKDQTCKPVHAFQADQRLAIGSAFKLYLLYAAAERVRLGSMRWDDTITLRDAWKSLPSGTMQLEPPGTPHSVKDLASAMISISDNTATDHLLFTLGRETVETIMKKDFKTDEANIPLLSTRELFYLKLHEKEAEKWNTMDKAARRLYLVTKGQETLTFPNPEGWVQPRFIDSIEWFASPKDLCQVLARFRDPLTREILALNPGIPLPPGTFRYQGFKGGSEPGVMSFNWLIQRRDERWFTLHLTVNDTKNALPEDRILALANQILLSINETR